MIQHHRVFQAILRRDFQQLAMTELPIIPLLRLDMVTILNKRVKNLAAGGLGIYDTFADVYVER